MPTSTPKRILLWSPRGAGTHYNGPGSFAYRLYQEQSLAVNDVTLAHRNRDQPASTPPFDQSIEVANQASALRVLLTSGTWASSHASEFDVFHGLGGFHPTVYPAWRAAKAGLPVVLFPMLSGVEFSHTKGLGGLLRLPAQRRRMIRSFSGFVAMSESIEDELLTSGVDASTIARIPMGIDCRRFSPSPKPKPVLRSEVALDDLPTVVFCGSLTPRKQPHLILEALHLVAQQTKVQAVFVGPSVDEEYTMKLKEQASILPKSVRCVFVGHTTEPERFLQASDVFCLPSRSEGLPASALEAMACSLAQVVTRLPGLDSYISDESAGFYVEPHARSLADQLLRALDSSETERSRARALVENRCSLQRVAAAHDHLFDLVVSGQSPNKASLES